MPTCTRCGTWNQDAVKTCEKCGAKVTPGTPAAGPVQVGTGIPTPPPLPPAPSGQSVVSAPVPELLERRRRKFFQFAALLVISLVAGVLLGKSANGKYDSSGPGVLDTNYTIETKTSNSGTVESTTYKVTYKFEASGAHYTGKDTLSTEPTDPETTVYYMAGNPRENGLGPNRAITLNIIASGVAFVIAIIAYWLLPKNYPLKFGAGAQAVVAGIGDSGNETAGMKRGKYGAWVHVHLAFFVQLALVTSLAALVLAVVSHTDATSYTILGVATFVAAAKTLWIYADRWRCIEAYSSRFCSGLANLSILYVPVVALVYANYRGLKKLQGR